MNPYSINDVSKDGLKLQGPQGPYECTLPLVYVQIYT